MKRRVLSLIAFASLLFLPGLVTAQTTLISWGFGTNGLSSGITGNSGVNLGTGGAFYSGVGCSWGQEAISNSISTGNAWSTGSFNTTGYTSINYTFRQMSFTSGPGQFKFQYRLSTTGTWIDLTTTYNTPILGGAGCGTPYYANAVGFPAAVNNQAVVQVRWLCMSGGSGGGGRLASVSFAGTASAGCTAPTVPTITGVSSVCPSGSGTLNISGTLNDATAWQIYSGSCGGTSVGSTSGSTFAVSPGSSTTYFVRGEGGCVTPGACGSRAVTVNSLDNASFSYGSAAYCVSDADPTPSASTAGTYSSTAGLSINSASGAIDVSTSTPGSYTITHLTTGTCPNSSTQGVTINGLDNASFSYGSAAYCVTDADPTPSASTAGTYSSTAGLSINPSSGAIDVSASTPGGYTITHLTTGTCPNSSTQGVTINGLDIASFNYGAASYCGVEADPTPTITGLTGGGFTATAGLSINASSGMIDLSASSAANHVVTYTTTGTCPNSANQNVLVKTFTIATISPIACGTYVSPGGKVLTVSNTYLDTIPNAAGCDSFLTINLTINPLPVVDFTSSEVCKSDSTKFTNTTMISVGTFTSEWFWGDGYSEVNSDTVVGHIYSSPLRFFATLEATSDQGCVASKSDSVFINPVPTAEFSVQDVCKGTPAVFVNSSVIGSGTFIGTWEFGDGYTFYSLTTATREYLYASTKTYTARLTNISDKGCSTTSTRTVSIFENPVAQFTVNNVCHGSSVQFINNSSVVTTNGAVINGYTWNFGDGSSESRVSPDHTYSTALTYNPQLIISTNQGCSDSIRKSVTMYEVPQANFLATGFCFGQNAIFTNSSTYSGGLTYKWEYGDGVIDSVANVSHMYPAAGSYNVTLTAISDKGCTNSITKSVKIFGNPSANFVTSDVCKDVNAVFTSISNIPANTTSKLYWNFGDGVKDSVVKTISHAYDDAITFNVNLRVVTTEGCEDDITKTITIYPLPNASFAVNDVCEGFISSFVNSSVIASGTMSTDWSFGDGFYSNLSSPTHTYGKALTFQVTLKLESDKGCKDELTKTTTIHPNPTPEFVTANQCDGTAAEFKNLSEIVSGSFSTLWTFHDAVTDTRFTSDKLYTGPGTYSVKLDLNSNKGCMSTVTKNVTIYPNPVANFSTSEVCEDEPTLINNLSSISSGTFSSNWTLGDGTITSLGAISHVYSTAGTYPISLTVVSDKGCSSSFGGLATVNPNPLAVFTTNGDVCLGTQSVFTNISVINSGTFSSAWDLGNGTTSVVTSPTVTYAAIDRYDIKLNVVSDKGCTDETIRSVLIDPNPIPSFTTNNVCLGTSTSFINTSSIDWGSYTSVWDFGDGSTSTIKTVDYKYSNAGVYAVRLDLVSDKGCTGSLTQNVEVYANPVADFTVDNVCDGFEITTVNNSTGATINNWELGESGITSTLTAPTHIYQNGPGTYTINLEVLTPNGCSDNISKNVTIYPNPVVTVSEDKTVSKGRPVTIWAEGGLDYIWDPAFTLDDPNSSSPVATVQETTEFRVIISDANSCMDTGYVNVTAVVDYLVFPRSVITPNGDGINDKFTIDNLSSYPNNSIIIIDRWGREVFQTDAYQQDWEGTKDGTSLPSGVYFYILTFDKNEDAIYKGSVTVIRSSN